MKARLTKSKMCDNCKYMAEIYGCKTVCQKLNRELSAVDLIHSVCKSHKFVIPTKRKTWL